MESSPAMSLNGCEIRRVCDGNCANPYAPCLRYLGLPEWSTRTHCSQRAPCDPLVATPLHKTFERTSTSEDLTPLRVLSRHPQSAAVSCPALSVMVATVKAIFRFRNVAIPCLRPQNSARQASDLGATPARVGYSRRQLLPCNWTSLASVTAWLPSGL
jgi:hypothetical protein